MSCRHPLPTVGDIVWCRFPQHESLGSPGPKPRPALIVAVSPSTHEVEVAYGTSQKTALSQIYPTEFLIDPHAQGGGASGLSLPTKFDMTHTVKLPFDSTWFSKAPGFSAHHPLPKMGVLPPLFYKAARQAAAAAKKR